MTSRSLTPPGYDALAPKRVREILMAASPYDSFVLEEDGRFSDQLMRQYNNLDLASAPRFHHVTSAKKALDRLRNDMYDMALITPHCLDMSPQRLSMRIRDKRPGLPSVMLTYHAAEAHRFAQTPREKGFAQVFLWTGDPKLLVALVKLVEDQLNVDHDIALGRVRVIIVVEDSPADYSALLPELYKELLEQVHRLMPESLHERDRQHRIGARPKVVLARNFEEAEACFERYKEHLLALFCDLRFPRGGDVCPDAGADFINLVRRQLPDLPILLQTREDDKEHLSKELRVRFCNKRTPDLAGEIGAFLKRDCGFGTFIFRDLEDREVDRADTLYQMADALNRAPAESLLFHAKRRHIFNWLMARGEYTLAEDLHPERLCRLENAEDMRAALISAFERFMARRQRGQITDFHSQIKLMTRDFTRIGKGSMGGKARGLAFVSHLLSQSEIHNRFPDIRIFTPRAAVIGTEACDAFCERHGLRERAAKAADDRAAADVFLQQPLDEPLAEFAEKIVSEIDYPLAVRSSSLQDDSKRKPFAGVYRTIMLPNCSPSKKVRFEQLSRAIRLVMASPFFHPARTYLENAAQRPDREKMAVLVQRLVGRRHGDLFYPDFAGVAQSLNYYPFGCLEADDGLANVALGLGKTVVDGCKSLRFSPRHPLILPQMSSPRSALANSQSEFLALDLSRSESMPDLDEACHLTTQDLSRAERDGALEALGATYSPENDVIYDTIYRPGVRLVNFAGILKHDRFPLAELLVHLLELFEDGMGAPIELEFAVCLPYDDRPAEFAALELRPLVGLSVDMKVSLNGLHGDRALVDAKAMGHGVMGPISDVIYILPEKLNQAHALEIAREIELLNRRLTKAQRRFLLIGPGRWGSADPWLGVPVDWSQVSGAGAIVEIELPQTGVDPSQGSHFFHNLTSEKVGYFCVNPRRKNHRLDLDWLESLPFESERWGVRHARLSQPIEARIDGRRGRGVVVPVKS